MPHSSEIQILLGILHCTCIQTYMGVTEGIGWEGRERRTLYPPPLHPCRAQATVLRQSSSRGSSSLCLNQLPSLPLLSYVGLKPPVLAGPGCLTSLWFYECCPHHCKWSSLRNLASVAHFEHPTAVYWRTYPQ